MSCPTAAALSCQAQQQSNQVATPLSNCMLYLLVVAAAADRHQLLLLAVCWCLVCRPAPAELQHLQLRLHGVISNQLQLLLRRCCLTMTTKLLEYSGLIVNYGCLALAVFGGWWAGAAEQGPGGVAARVSLASFYLLTLVYSYTQVRAGCVWLWAGMVDVCIKCRGGAEGRSGSGCGYGPGQQRQEGSSMAGGAVWKPPPVLRHA